jgi:hypothetical protein
MVGSLMSSGRLKPSFVRDLLGEDAFFISKTLTHTPGRLTTIPIVLVSYSLIGFIHIFN